MPGFDGVNVWENVFIKSIRIKRNLHTGEYQKGSAELIEFIDFEEEEESPEAYLNRLIAEAKPFMDEIEDPDEWAKACKRIWRLRNEVTPPHKAFGELF